MEVDTFQAIMGRFDSLDNRIGALEINMKDQVGEHFDACQKFCLSEIKTVDAKAEKAHVRLDRQKKEIEKICEYKNEEIGARKATRSYINIITVMVAILGVTIAGLGLWLKLRGDI